MAGTPEEGTVPWSQTEDGQLGAAGTRVSGPQFSPRGEKDLREGLSQQEASASGLGYLGGVVWGIPSGPLILHPPSLSEAANTQSKRDVRTTRHQ